VRSRCLCRRRSSAIRTRATSGFFVGAAANKRYSAYSFRRATIAYRWHPLFRRTLQVSYNRRGSKDLTCIYTEERPDLARELPNWMFDERYCAGMSLGPPRVSIEALNTLAAMLATSGKSRQRGARWRPSEAKEAIRAEEKEPGSKTTRAGARTAAADAVSSTPELKGADRNAGRSPVGSARRTDGEGRSQRGRRS
jgi:hypothetical protein